MEKSKAPKWYWTRGLHDAKIVSVLKKESKWNPEDNCLILKINGDGAMGEANITEIRFYNFKINCGDISLLNDGWWLSDELQEKGNGYFLRIKFETTKCKTKNLEFVFRRAEVDRK